MNCESSPLSCHQDKDSFDKTSNPSAEHAELQNSADLEEVPLEEIIAKGSDSQFQAAIYRIGQKIQFEDSQSLINCKTLHHRLLKLFYRLYKEIGSGKERLENILFVISLLAEILRKNSSIKLPFSKKTALSLLTFDSNTLDNAKGKYQIMMILVILTENMARQGRLMKRLGVHEQLKEGLLLLISKADEFSALQILLRALLELQSKSSLTVTSQELDQTWVTGKIRDVFGDRAVVRIKSILCQPKIKAIKTISNMTLIELVSHR